MSQHNLVATGGFSCQTITVFQRNKRIEIKGEKVKQEKQNLKLHCTFPRDKLEFLGLRKS